MLSYSCCSSLTWACSAWSWKLPSSSWLVSGSAYLAWLRKAESCHSRLQYWVCKMQWHLCWSSMPALRRQTCAYLLHLLFCWIQRFASFVWMSRVSLLHSGDWWVTKPAPIGSKLARIDYLLSLILLWTLHSGTLGYASCAMRSQSFAFGDYLASFGKLYSDCLINLYPP